MDFKSKIIQEVFANKVKSSLSNNSKVTFADGGRTDNEIYSPIEFLNTFLKIISVEEGIEKEMEISKMQKVLDDEIEKKLSKYRVNSIFLLPVDELEGIEMMRRDIESQKMFITKAELDAYVICNPELPKENYVNELRFSREELIDMGLIMLDYVDGGHTWVYKWQYLSGNIQEKISRCTQFSEKLKIKISENQFLNQLAELEKVKNPLARITEENKNKIFLSPNSFFATDKGQFTVEPDDYETYDKISYATTLAESFKTWIQDKSEVESNMFTVSFPKNVVKYYVDREELPNDKESARIKENAQVDGQRLFEVYLNRVLNSKCKKRLEIVWNAKFNNFIEPKKYKIPIALTCSKKWKKNSDFAPNQPQIQSVQFLNESGSGLLAYGVGVGKTASAILNMSYAFDNNLSEKALLVVPNATYQKWKGEITGYNTIEYTVSYEENSEIKTKVFAEEKEATKFSKTFKNSKITSANVEIKGILPHIRNVVGLENLNKNVVFSLKDYTPKEKIEIADGEDLLIYLNKIPKDYNFDNREINNEIEKRYGNFELDYVIQSYNTYAINQEASKKKAQPIFTWWKKSVTDYVTNLYYKLGILKTYTGKTIFITTFEGLVKFGVEDLSIEKRNDINNDKSFLGKIYMELRQGDSFESLKYYGKSNRFADELEEKMFGGVGENKIFLKELGIDFAVFDESHFFKKVFVNVKGKPQYNPPYYNQKGDVVRNAKKYEMKMASTPSTRAIYGYIVSRYVQINNKNRNVLHLTATPFTNSPIEVYSMLALTNYERLIKAGFSHIEDFFDTFMRIAYDLRFTASQTIERDEVLIGYNNTPQLRTLIYSIMDYKNGDDANIKRPEKIVYPSVSKGIETVIMPNDLQKEYFDLIKKYVVGEYTMEQVCGETVSFFDIEEKTDDELIAVLDSQEGMETQKEKYAEIDLPLNEKDRSDLESLIIKILEKNKEKSVNEEDLSLQEKSKFRILKGLSMIKQVTLSPYLFACSKKTNIEPTYKEYVESSPKLLYIVNSIKSMKDFEEQKGIKKSGSVIYMNLGVNPKARVLQEGVYVEKKWNEGGFDKIKKYFVKELGYSENEISIVKGGGMSNEQKEREKNKFLAGESTVLIGSSTISTGVDLQNNASTLFLGSYDWNPTDNEQVAGRIYRQGNRFAYVRIVYPMIENSADPVIFQQLQEKTMRIKEIWDREGKKGELDISDFDPTLLKERLITDPKAKADMWLEKESNSIKNDISILETRLNETFRDAEREYNNINNLREPIRGLLVVWDAYKKNKEKEKYVSKIEEKTKEAKVELEETLAELRAKLEEDDDFGNEFSKLIKKAKDKYNKIIENASEGEYDFVADKDGKFVLTDFSNYSDEDLVKEIYKIIQKDSTFNKYKDEQGYNFINQLNLFIDKNYPNYYNGIYGTEQERKELEEKIDLIDEKQKSNRRDYDNNKNFIRIISEELGYDREKIESDPRFIEKSNKLSELDDDYNQLSVEFRKLENTKKSKFKGVRVYFESYGGIISQSATFKDAVKLFEKLKFRLETLDIKVDELELAKEKLVNQLDLKRAELQNIELKYNEKFQEFTKLYLENLSTAPSVLVRVDEFADDNEKYLIPQLITFNIDKTKPTKIEVEAKVIDEPIKEEKEVKEIVKKKPIKVIEKTPTFVEQEEEENDLQFLVSKLEATNDLISLLEMSGEDSDDLEFLKELKTATEDLISLLELV